ncbi:hypothetical protein B0H14DRAFT_3643415 [Mycena olivaceomarginata]|nr:hypothetical protein B0H14DRAFT_3643415 [Mycena olivaceomarginata]
MYLFPMFCGPFFTQSENFSVQDDGDSETDLKSQDEADEAPDGEKIDLGKANTVPHWGQLQQIGFKLSEIRGGTAISLSTGAPSHRRSWLGQRPGGKYARTFLRFSVHLRVTANPRALFYHCAAPMRSPPCFSRPSIEARGVFRSAFLLVRPFPILINPFPFVLAHRRQVQGTYKAGGSEVPTKVRRAGLTVKRMKGAPTLLLSGDEANLRSAVELGLGFSMRFLAGRNFGVLGFLRTADEPRARSLYTHLDLEHQNSDD